MALEALRKTFFLDVKGSAANKLSNEIRIIRVAPHDFYEIRFKTGRTPQALEGQFTSIMAAETAIRNYVETGYRSDKYHKAEIVKTMLHDPMITPWEEAG